MDARWELDTTKRLAKMTSEQRAAVRRAEALVRQGVGLYRRGKAGEARSHPA